MRSSSIRMVPFALLWLAGTALSGEILVDYSLPDGAWDVSSFEGAELPICAEGVVGFEEGLPNLPVVSYCYVIPQGSTVTAATLEVLSETDLGSGHDVLPVRFAVFGEGPGPFLRDMQVYLSDDAFPSDQVVSFSTGVRTGFRLGSVQFTPFSYNPLSGGLSVMTSARLRIRYESDPAAPVYPLTDDQISNAEAILQGIVRNPEDLAYCRPAVHSTDSTVEWVAIGSGALQATIQPLVDFRNAMGLRAEYVTTEWIYANYTGYDTQEQIRNYLVDAYLTSGLMYALMIGDWGATQRMSSLDVGGGTVLNETADLYFSDLTRTWDWDGDHLYGENSDFIDYYSDIAVGRFSSDNSTHLLTQVQKTIAYEMEPSQGAWRTSALLCGAGLWPESDYWGSFVCDSISRRIPAGWTQYKLYENTSGHPTNQIELVNQGVCYVSDQGHGNSGGVYWYYSPGNMFTNGNYTGMDNLGMLTVFHSMACDPGQLSVYGCNAERLMMWPNGGAIAVMYNSDYGWGTPPAMGPSEWLEVHFADQMFVQSIPRIGDIQAAAKDAFRAAGGMTLQNWVLQENNMLGDPATVFITYETGIEEGDAPGASAPALGPAFPNPCTGSFSLSWSLPVESSFSVGIYDLSGRLVRDAGNVQASGVSGVLLIDGLAEDGSPLSPGVYTVRLECQTGDASSRVVVLGD